ncbi:MAG: Gfo/Idh/MocA family oxidoreductase [Planctomycetia bacterium]|nr:Gfo/Idh/MocA family oxidoreductase [Planctomycetia bacterium]
MKKLKRRHFLALSALAAPVVMPGKLLGREGFVPPNEKIHLALIGKGNRGNDHIGMFCGNPDFQLTAVCDCWDAHMRDGKSLIDRRYGNHDCRMFQSYEEILTRKEFDAISIATPDHWHTKIALEACRAGMDVFSEKPLTLTLLEGRQIVAGARKYNRVCSSGSQRVMEDYGYMAPIIQSGVVGEVREIHVGVGPAGVDCYLPEEPTPEGLDWDRWLGQAPWAPFNAERMSGSYGGGWRRFSDYGNGFLADWGAHKYGGALYACGMDHMVPVKVFQPNTEANPSNEMLAVFPNGVKVYHGGPHDITIIGTEGEYRHRQPAKPRHAVNVRRYHGGATNIVADFAFCVRNRLRPFQDFFYGARTAALCQIFNIAYKTGHDLTWDDENMVFVGDEVATRMVSRPQRAPYTFEV